MKHSLNKNGNNVPMSGCLNRNSNSVGHTLGNYHRVLNFKVSGARNIASVQQFLRIFCSPIASLPENATELKCTLTLDSESSAELLDNQFREMYNLTPRECEVLKRIAVGKTNMNIAVDLNLTYNTVRNHLKNIYFKLGARNKTEASMVYFGHFHDIPDVML